PPRARATCPRWSRRARTGRGTPPSRCRLPRRRGRGFVSSWPGSYSLAPPLGHGYHRPTMAGDLILETESLTKEFRGFVAVKDVRLQVRRGSIHAPLRPDGGGQTTPFHPPPPLPLPTPRR